MAASKPHSTFTDFALVREGLMEAGHPTGGARLSALDRIEEQLEAATSEDFSLVPKDEYARLKGIEEQFGTLRDEIDHWLALYQSEGLDAGGALDGIAEALDASYPAKERP